MPSKQLSEGWVVMLGCLAYPIQQGLASVILSLQLLFQFQDQREA